MSESNKDLFRKVSLERLSSPEQLDELIKVTRARGWVALFTIIGMLIALLLWGILGQIPTKVQGEMVLTSSQGLVAIQSPSSGIIRDLAVAPGSWVEQNQVIARIYQPDLSEDIFNTKNELNELIKKSILNKAAWEKEKVTSEKQLQVLLNRAKDQKFLFEKGLIIKSKWLETLHEMYLLKDSLDKYKINIIESENKIKELKRRLNSLLNKYEGSSEVVSNFSGRVVEVRTDYNSIVKQGDSLILVEPHGRDIKVLEAVIFVSPLDGKKIKSGMIALLSPSQVNKEEYGSLKSKVIYVSRYPETTSSLMNLLQNEDYVKTVTSKGFVYSVKADLIYDKDTPSGYAWTSGKGAPIKLQSGSVGTAQITVRLQRPISLVFPMIKDMLGVNS